MTCKDIEGVLLDYIRGMLSKEEADRVGEHIKDCPRCASELKELMPMGNLCHVASLLKAEPPESHMQNIMAMAGKYMPKPQTSSDSSLSEKVAGMARRIFSLPAMPVFASIALAFFIIGALVIWRYARHPLRIDFQIGELRYWTEEGMSGTGVAGREGHEEERYAIQGFCIVPTSTLVSIINDQSREDIIIILETISDNIRQIGEKDDVANRYQKSVIKNITTLIMKKKIDRIDLRMQKSLQDILRTTSEKELAVRFALIKEGKKVTVEFGRYGG
ncbi:MAG: zf-HC2 domain-containing protein [Deltaproteobacteria bacterium]|nr:zf-HC2 domain-containing protein [Deltaproteobacteria bacterium]